MKKEKLTEVISIRVTAGEKKMIRKACKRKGLTATIRPLLDQLIGEVQEVKP